MKHNVQCSENVSSGEDPFFIPRSSSIMSSLSSLLAVLSGLLILGGACYLVATKRRPSVLAAYLVLLPLPVLITVCGSMNGLISSLTVIAASPNVTLTTSDIAAAIANSLFGLLVALLISVPPYIVLAVGLLLRTMRSQSDSANFAPIRTESPTPLWNPAGPIPVSA